MIEVISDKLSLSRYSIIVPCDSGGLAINSLYRSVVKLPKATYRRISCRGGISTLDADEKHKLLEAKIITLENNEMQIFKDWIKRIQDDTSSLRTTICVTSRCNLDCAYCFENGYIKREPMDLDESTVENLVAWLKRFAILNKSRVVSFYYYGGEPSLCSNMIQYLSEILTKEFEKLGILVSFSMYTNGAYLSANLLETIKQFDFQKLQITLDGPAFVHDKRRPFKGGRGSFDVIFNNIERLLEETKTKILLLTNFDRQNSKSVPELLEKFTSYCGSQNIEFAFNPVFKTECNREHCQLFSLSEPESYRAWRKLQKAAIRRGLNCRPLTIFEKGPCSFLRKSHLIFSPNGDIYKCIGLVGRKEFSVGNIKDNFMDIYEKICSQISIAAWDNDKCRNCEMLPLCLGGCRFHSLVEHGNIVEPFCHKNLIKNVELKLIKELTGAGNSAPCLLNSL